MRQNEVRATEHHNTPSRKARQPGRHKSNQIPRGRDQRKTGPGRHKGPTAGGREASIGRGGEPTTAKQTTEKRRPNHPQKGARRPRTDAHSRAGRNTDTTQSQPKRGHAREKAKHKTKDNGRQGEHSPDQDRTEPTHQTKQKGGPRGDRTPTEARKRIPTTPQQVGANRNVAPKERGHRR